MSANIVLDTNAIFDHWYLTGPSIMVLQRFMALTGSRLIIPEIVLLETVNLFQREVAKARSQLRKLERFGNIDTSQVIHDIDLAPKEYEQKLRSRLSELQAEIISHENIPHSRIVARVLDRRKPFGQSGKGYRDTLLWEVILSKIATVECVTFLVTNNHVDFGIRDKQGELHSDLVEDLAAAELPEDRVCLCPSLNVFVREHATPGLEKATATIVEQLRQGRYGTFSIVDWFNEHREKLLSEDRLIDILSFSPELESPELSYMEEIKEVEVEDVAKLDDDRVFIDAVVASQVVIDVFIYHSNYYLAYEHYPISVMDDSWNESYTWAQVELSLPIAFSLVFNLLTETVEAFETSDIPEILGFCHLCGEAIVNDAAETCTACGRSLITRN
ncbi:MAG: DUF4935 domain-containing protein [Planctomycetes bacterium]|nr:DUF4935 domain-containing protein [Planctomycetota bacterium]